MPKDYPYLRAWNRMMRSNPDYNVEQARQDKAPQTTIYNDYNDTWVTVDQIKNPETRALIEKLANEFK